MPFFAPLIRSGLTTRARRPASTLAAGFDALRRRQEAQSAPDRPSTGRPLLRISDADCDFLSEVNRAVRGLVNGPARRGPSTSQPAVEAVIDRFRSRLPHLGDPATLRARFSDDGYPVGDKTWPSMADQRAREMLCAAAPGSHHLLVGPDLQVVFSRQGRFMHEDKVVTVLQPAEDAFLALCKAAQAAGMSEVPALDDTEGERCFRLGRALLRLIRSTAGSFDLAGERFDSISDLNAACIYEPAADARRVLAVFAQALAPEGVLLASVKSAGDRHSQGITLSEVLEFAHDAGLTARIVSFSHFADSCEPKANIQHVLREELDVASSALQDRLARLDRECAFTTQGVMCGVARWGMEFRRR